MKQAGVLLAAAVAIAMIAAGCGGGGSSTTASITKAEFVKKGNAICASGSKKMQADFESYAKKEGLKEGKEPSEAQSKELGETVLIPVVAKEVEEIKALGFPSEEGEGAEAVIESAEESIAEGEEEPAALLSGGKAFQRTNKLAREYGLTSCGEE